MTREQQKTNEHWGAFMDNGTPDEKVASLLESLAFKPKKRVLKLRSKLEGAKKIKQKQAEKRHEAANAAAGHQRFPAQSLKMALEPMPCPVADCSFKAHSRAADPKQMQTKLESE